MGNKSSCCVTNSPSVSSTYRSGAGVHPSANNNNNNSIRSTHNNESSKKYQHGQPGVHLNYSGVGYHGNQRGGGGGNNLNFEYDNHQPYHHNQSNHSSSAAWIRDETSCNLQHISEREPDDIDQDPSTHPTKGPIFMERSKSEIKIRDNRLSLYFINNALRHQCAMSSSSFRVPIGSKGGTGHPRSGSPTVPYARLVKSSSCSTVFLDDSTISQPNLKNTIRCISLAIYYHIANRKNRGTERLMDIFEERKHPITSDPIPVDYEFRDPEHKYIYRFIRILFTSAQLTAECAIITLVYIERLLTYAEIDLCPSNWRRVVLGAIMLASKVWDDQAVWNIDYCQILRRCTVDDMNELERQFLECLEFNINVPSSVYAKYYFDLRTLAIANDLHLPLQPLYKERAKKLEALSRIYEDKFLDVHKKSRRRWSSDHRINAMKNTVVIS